MFLQEHFYVFAILCLFVSIPSARKPTLAKVGMNISSRYGNEGEGGHVATLAATSPPFSFPTLVIMWISRSQLSVPTVREEDFHKSPGLTFRAQHGSPSPGLKIGRNVPWGTLPRSWSSPRPMKRPRVAREPIEDSKEGVFLSANRCSNVPSGTLLHLLSGSKSVAFVRNVPAGTLFAHKFVSLHS